MTTYTPVSKNSTSYTGVSKSVVTGGLSAGMAMGLLLVLTYATTEVLDPYTATTKNSTSYTGTTKNSTSFTGVSKNSTSYTAVTKN